MDADELTRIRDTIRERMDRLTREMPDGWQEKMDDLLKEYRQTFSNQPDTRVSVSAG